MCTAPRSCRPDDTGLFLLIYSVKTGSQAVWPTCFYLDKGEICFVMCNNVNFTAADAKIAFHNCIAVRIQPSADCFFAAATDFSCFHDTVFSESWGDALDKVHTVGLLRSVPLCHSPYALQNHIADIAHPVHTMCGHEKPLPE